MRVYPRRIKLMPDYQCFCLWGVDIIDNIAPDVLPLSKDLKERLTNWETEFDNTLDMKTGETGFETPEKEKEFIETGWSLLKALRKEMPDVEFYYFDIGLSELLKNKPSA